MDKMEAFDVRKFDVAKYDYILKRGLSHGVGKREGQMCIEAAICATLDLPHDDDPGCVAAAVRSFKIRLNDSGWSSPQARAAGLRDLGLAQLGSLGVVDDREFAKRMAKKTIRVLIPKLFREIFAGNAELEKAADRCEKEASRGAVMAAGDLAYAAYAYDAAAAAHAAAYADAAYAAAHAAAYADAAYDAYDAAYAAAYAAAKKNGTSPKDTYLLLAASLALETLRELKSPGCELLTGEREG